MRFPRTSILLRQCERQLSNNCIRPGTAATAKSPLPRWPAAGRQQQHYATAVSAAELEFGQPVHETHPHLLKAGEITPGITAQEYASRRAALARLLPEDGVAIFPAAELKYRSGAVFFPFRQESDFMYLTGFLEPDAVAVIRRTSGVSSTEDGDYEFHLFCRPKDPRAEQWSGPWSGLLAARDVFNADEAHDIAALEDTLRPILRSASRVYTPLAVDTASAEAGTRWAGLATTLSQSCGGRVSGVRSLLNELRAVKSAAEIANMRLAGRASGRALTEAMRQPWTREQDLAAFLDYEFIRNGCEGPAYVPVVAGGRRGCLIHYVHNNAALHPSPDAGEMVLVDAGGERGGYVTDITRTWPLSGRFSAAQRDLYSALLRVQREGVALCRADAGVSLDQIHRVTEDRLREELRALGFDIPGSSGRDDPLGVLFPHHVGHYVGLDVHDVPGHPRSRPLKKGHCITIEPGVYVPDDERWPKHFRGLGIRIEDSVCVDEDSPLVLTTEAVKEVDDIEALREV